jgi:hypothetical protein
MKIFWMLAGTAIWKLDDPAVLAVMVCWFIFYIPEFILHM